MKPASLEQLLKIILTSYDKKQEIFDIPEKLFYKHWHHHTLYTEKYGQKIHNPIGLSSGPLTQLAQNIVSGWLCGARFIELKTVQPNSIADRIKPSIDIFDGAYNCEKSSELSVEEAYDQYLNAWIIIHILNHKIFSEIQKYKDIGTIFNMSLGYTLSDIRSEKMQWFVDKMINCSIEKEDKIKKIKKIYPDITKIKIPDQISNNFTVNTSKGCSARELEYICKFLIIDKKLHPGIKISPKLLGYRSVMAILNTKNTFNVEVNQDDFENSIQYGEAITLIENILEDTKEMGLQLTVKISNSLTCKNNSTQIPGAAEEVYLSGRALHPIAVNLAAKFQSKFEGLLDISFSGGANCFNISNLIQNGFSSITVCTDLLKPGGYGRLSQYFSELSKGFTNYQAKSIREFILKSGNEYGVKESAIENLRNYAIRTLSDPAYQKTDISGISIKSQKPLPLYDCIVAPCTVANPVKTDTPGYCWNTHKNDAEKAFHSILAENPLPSILGMIGDDNSRQVCTRNNYDQPVRMKDLERFITEFAPDESKNLIKLPSNKFNVAVIGGGISGLACAWYLSRYGFHVDIYDGENHPGGMANSIIP
ncbi:MAG: FAD-dependent oxidoreductase, partial [Bacteroidales bacterium]|nr:FAD-dependent oxidoreductase [Bacteroidales bacterium]